MENEALRMDANTAAGGWSYYNNTFYLTESFIALKVTAQQNEKEEYDKTWMKTEQHTRFLPHVRTSYICVCVCLYIYLCL